MDIYFDKNNFIVYKGITLSIHREQIMDLQMYGIDPINYIEKFYRENIQIIRDKKISDILGK